MSSVQREPVNRPVRSPRGARVSLIAAVALVVLAVEFSRREPLAAEAMMMMAAVLSILTALRLLPNRAPADQADTTAVIAGEIETLKDAAWELGEKEARYRDLLDSQSEVIVRYDVQGRVTFANRAYCRLFGLEQATVLGTAFVPEVVPAALHEGLAPTAGLRIEQVRGAAGLAWIEWDEHTVPVDGGRRLERQLVGRDVTARVAMERELAQARDDAQAASRAKSRFLAAMSHEIRTPMSGILGMASLLMESGQRPEQRTYTEAIDASAKTLLALIDEILDFSKIEAGKLELSRAPFSIAKCVQSSVELLAPRAHDRGLEIAWTLDPGMPDLVEGDEARLRQVLLNLIGNAVKFTDRGGILVNVGRNDDGTLARIEIKDTGIGVSPEIAERLFAEFSQSDAPEARDRGGTGLGLAISRRLARAMGGDIRLDSAPGLGATFTVDIALHPVAGAGPVLELPSHGETRPRVLLAVDGAIESRALAGSLRGFGVEPVELSAERLEPEDELPDCGQVDLVILDARLGDVVAARVLRQCREQSGRPTKGVILIDSQSRSGIDRYRKLGFASYLVRPVRPQSLLAQIGMTPPGFDHHPDDIEVPVPEYVDLGLNVLLAEDNQINALLATHMLSRIGCTTTHVPDGLAAVEAIEASLTNRERSYDVVLMDVHMPRLDGLQAAAALKRLARSAPVPPVIALTANAFPEDRAACLSAGYDDYLSKPFGKEELVALLKRWCLTARGEAA